LGERFKPFTYEELSKRDKVNLNIFWLKDDALEESARSVAGRFADLPWCCFLLLRFKVPYWKGSGAL
jgi:hypothetical protein